MSNNLPHNWTSLSLGKAVFYKKGKKPKTLFSDSNSSRVPYLDIKAFEKNVYSNYCAPSDAVLIDEDEIAIVWDGARSGWVSKGLSGALGSTLASLKSIEIPSDFLYRFLQFQYSYINTNVRGIGIPHVDPEKLWNISMPIPPEKEIIRISKKLERILSHIDSLNSRIDTIPQLLKQFRQQVLSYAVSGKLTENWRKKNPVVEKSELLLTKIKKEIDRKFKEDVHNAKETGKQKPKDHRKNKKSEGDEFEINNLPVTWCVSRLEDITYLVTDGTHYTPTYINNGVPFLSVKNVRPFKIFDKDIKFISHEQHAELNKRCNPVVNDILYTKVGATYGYACVNKLDYPFSIFVSLALIKPVYNYIDSKFLEIIMNSQLVYNQAKNRISGIGTPDLHLIEIRDFKIPVAPHEEQKEIVRQVEILFAFADAMEEKYKQVITSVKQLPNSILKKAFEGLLVRQNPKDEPAEKLVERIMKIKNENQKKNKK